MRPNFSSVCVLLLAIAIVFSAFHKNDLVRPAEIYYPKEPKASGYSPVNQDTAGAMISAYEQFPLPIASAGSAVKAFQIDPKDFANIKSKIGGYQSIILYLGVQNYKPAIAKQQAPIYTLVVVPLKTDGTADLQNMAEYVEPCPPVCPPNPPGGPNH